MIKARIPKLINETPQRFQIESSSARNSHVG